MNDEVETMWKEAVVAYFKILCRNLPEGTEENYDSRCSSWDSNHVPPEFKFRSTVAFINIFLFLACCCVMSRDSSVGIATGYGLDGRRVGVRVPVGPRIFSSPHRPDRLWGPPSLLPNGYRRFFPLRKAARNLKPITHLQLVPRTRIRGSVYPVPYTPSFFCLCYNIEVLQPLTDHVVVN
jgi:hypothetical protein